MSLPTPGVTVTVIVLDGAYGKPDLAFGDPDTATTKVGNVVSGVGDWGEARPHFVWEPVSRDYRMTLLEEDEGRTWSRGGNTEIRGALLAAYRLSVSK